MLCCSYTCDMIFVTWFLKSNLNYVTVSWNSICVPDNMDYLKKKDCNIKYNEKFCTITVYYDLKMSSAVSNSFPPPLQSKTVNGRSVCHTRFQLLKAVLLRTGSARLRGLTFIQRISVGIVTRLPAGRYGARIW